MKRIATIFAFIGLFAQPALADGTINTLSAGAALSGTEQIPMFQTANPAVTTTPNALKTFIGAGSGTVTSISAGCGSSTGGGAITTTGTIAAVNNPLHPTSGNFVAATVCGNTAYYDSASDQSPTLPTAASAGAGGFFTTCSVNHAQTITRSGSDTIGITGAATTYSLGSGTVTAPTCVGFQSDGTSIWTPTPYGSSGASGITIGTTTVSGGAAGNMLYTDGSLAQATTAWTYASSILTNTQALAANTSGDGLVLTNTTAATSGNQRLSPRLHFSGQGFQTTGSATQTTDIILENLPLQGTSTTSGTTLQISYQLAGGGYTPIAGIGYGNGGGVYFTGKQGNGGTANGNSMWIRGFGSGNSIWGVAANATGVATSSNQIAVVFATGAPIYQFTMAGTNTELGFSSSGDAAGTIDTFMTRGGAAATLQFGAFDAAAPVAQIFQVQSVVTGTSNTAGANWTINASNSTGTGVGGKIIMQTTVTGSSGSTPNSRFPMLTLNPGSITTSTVQFGDGTNITTYDSCTALTTGATGVVACTASAMRFKNPIGSVTSTDLSNLHPATWTYKDQQRFGEGTFVGLYADDVEKMDPDCVVYDHGQLKDYRDRCVIAHLVAAVKDLQARVH